MIAGEVTSSNLPSNSIYEERGNIQRLTQIRKGENAGVTSSNESTGPSKVELSFGIERILDKDHSERFGDSSKQFDEFAINGNHSGYTDSMLGNYANPTNSLQLFNSAQFLPPQTSLNINLSQPSVACTKTNVISPIPVPQNFLASLPSNNTYSKTSEPVMSRYGDNQIHSASKLNPIFIEVNDLSDLQLHAKEIYKVSAWASIQTHGKHPSIGKRHLPVGRSSSELNEPPYAHNRLDATPLDNAEQPLDLSNSRNIPPFNDSTNLNNVTVTEQSKIQFPHLMNHPQSFGNAPLDFGMQFDHKTGHKGVLSFQQMTSCRVTVEQRPNPLSFPSFHETASTYSTPLIETSSQQTTTCTDVAERNLNPSSNEPTQRNKVDINDLIDQ
ncbi:hypothetical protein ACTXT7_006570 [Hymenolepis weldensis]